MRQLNIIIATNIKQKRIIKGYTQNELAIHSKRCKSTISKIETERLPSVDTLCNIANALNLTLNEICGRSRLYL